MEKVGVLIVDDNPDDRLLASHELRKEFLDPEIREAGDLEAVSRALREPPYDLVILDYCLNWGDSMAMLKRIKSEWPDTAVIMFTGTGSEESAVDGMKAGLDDYVLKKLPHRARLGPAARKALDGVRQRRLLREKESEYRRLFERSVAGIFSTTWEGRLLNCNMASARIYGYESPGQMLSECRSALDLYAKPEDRERFLGELRKRGSVSNWEVCHKRRDGSPFWIAENASLVHDAAGGADLIEGTLVDITEHKTLEDQLRQAQKMEAVGRLAGGVAHDFNNLLGVIMGFSDLLLERSSLDAPARHQVEQIKKAGQRATTMTRQLLAFSRREVIEPRVLNLNSLISELEKMLRRIIREDIDLQVLGDPSLGTVRADPGQIEQAIINLVVNARDAMPNGGNITISTHNVTVDRSYVREHPLVPPGQYVMISVSDTGIGMTPETKNHIFEPFFTTKEKGKGTGLGLSMVYGVVKQSSGFIWVYSEPGVGTTFKIYFPCVHEPAEGQSTISQGEEVPVGVGTILLVEDEEMLRDFTRECLESAGYSVLTAADGTKAIQEFENHHQPIDLLLTDVVMPGANGHDVANRLTQSRPGLKVLYVSGYAEDVVVHHGVIAPGVNFLQKPFTRAALLRKVRKVLDSEGQQQEQNDSRAMGDRPLPTTR